MSPNNWLTRTLPGAVAGISCLYLSWVLVGVWLDPMARDNGSWVPFAVGLLVIEFLALHSSVFITNLMAEHETLTQRLKFGAGLTAFYLLMAVGIAAGVGSPSLVLILASIMVSRIISAFTASPETKAHNNARAAVGIVLYVGLAGATVFVAVPEMGITTSVLNEVYPNRGGGVWERYPERPIVAGAIYFGLIGLAELYWALKEGR
ncbi:MAG: hypothetical protein GKR90_15440 [Pseudomonadales bacterium]|nr:hypothetical protein [Pseudomonadales bacterium]